MMEIVNKTGEVAYLKSLADKLKSGFSDYPIALQGGLMGMGLMLYRGAYVHKEESWQELADRLLEEVVERLPTEEMSCDFKQGLSGVGWGIAYLLKHDFVSGDTEVLEDFDMLFRKILMLNRASSNEIVGIGVYLTEEARLKCNRPFGREMKQVDRNMLLCLKRIERYWGVINGYENKWLLWQCFAVLIDFYRFNVFRFKLVRLFNLILDSLQENRENMGTLERVYVTRLLAKLCAIACEDDSFIGRTKQMYDSFVNTLEHTEKGIAVTASPFILKSEGQYYLMTEEEYCIHL